MAKPLQLLVDAALLTEAFPQFNLCHLGYWYNDAYSNLPSVGVCCIFTKGFADILL